MFCFLTDTAATPSSNPCYHNVDNGLDTHTPTTTSSGDNKKELTTEMKGLNGRVRRLGS